MCNGNPQLLLSSGERGPVRRYANYDRCDARYSASHWPLIDPSLPVLFRARLRPAMTETATTQMTMTAVSMGARSSRISCIAACLNPSSQDVERVSVRL